MDISDLLNLGAKVFSQSEMSGQAGSNLDLGSLASALSGLAGGNSENGGLDLGAIIGKMRVTVISSFF